jgi:lysine 6-dehydrogenase
MKIAVLGAGMVGAVIARDLAEIGGFDVLLADINEEALAAAAEESDDIRIMKVDLGTAAGVGEAVAGARVAVSAVPGHMGYATLRRIIEAGIDVVDIAFMPEDALALDALAREHGVTAVVDFGVAPGLSHFLIGRSYSTLDRTDWCDIVVGGLPKLRVHPWEYAAPFSPMDVLEEYTRTARMVEGGKIIEKPALSEPELVTLPRVGTLEAFNTDGLRTLLTTLDIPKMREKTLRYPGYADKIRLLVQSGYLGYDPIDVGGVSIRPIDLTARLLFRAWKLSPGMEEFTVMRVAVEGEKDGQAMRHMYFLYDEYDADTRTSSMARTTGFPPAIMAGMLARDEFVGPGIIPPEKVGGYAVIYDMIMARLNNRGVKIVVADMEI